tara:strand:- start:841 stop:1059 length:219 start_codon:yes stop_codon:yes gene_type:complete
VKLDIKPVMTGVAITVSAALIMGFSSTVSEADSRSIRNAKEIESLSDKEKRIYDNVEIIRQDVKEILSRLPK